MKNKIRLIGVIFLAVLLVFSIAACKSAEEKAQDSLQGVWKNADFGEITFDKNTFKGNGMEGTFVAKDGTLTITASKVDNVNVPAPLKYEFTYSLSSDSKTLTIKGKKDTIAANLLPEDTKFTKQ